MKLIIDIPEDALPEPFKTDDPAGLQNILSFLHEQLVCLPMEKATDNLVQEPYRKAFYDQQKLNGQAHVDAIRTHGEADVALGKLICANLRVER